ncbi:hypothetical protein M407DRAFT_86955, partial [Tulasnella calospora MUT 4182]
MTSERWGILGLQETHDAREDASWLERSNNKFWVFNNPGTSRARGTAIVFNRYIVKGPTTKEEVTHEILIEGRAQLLKFKWRDEESITVVNVYAPNVVLRAAEFYKELERKLQGRRVHFMMGDFNHVEMEIDRFPVRKPSSPAATDALKSLREAKGLWDGWRLENEATRQYTWSSLYEDSKGRTLRARLDRILTTPGMMGRAVEWKFESHRGISDHSPVLVTIRNRATPEVGGNRWRMRPEDLQDANTVSDLLATLKKTETTMK